MLTSIWLCHMSLGLLKAPCMWQLLPWKLIRWTLSTALVQAWTILTKGCNHYTLHFIADFALFVAILVSVNVDANLAEMPVQACTVYSIDSSLATKVQSVVTVLWGRQHVGYMQLLTLAKVSHEMAASQCVQQSADLKALCICCRFLAGSWKTFSKARARSHACTPSSQG